MIKLCDGKITDILPENLASQVETQALAYAIHRQIKRLCELADKANIYGAIENAPEEILDYLAIELRTPCYDMGFPLETKRRLVIATIPFRMKMGTTAMVNAVVQAIFGEGHINEYWEAGLKPHHFTVHVTGAQETTHPTADLRGVLEEVKRKSQWLDAVEMEFDTMDMTLGVGVSAGTIMTTPIQEAPDNIKFRGSVVMAGMAGTITTTPIQEI